jgi:very-short-patch-repair endonuclease
MPVPNIVRGQRINPEKLRQAKELRSNQTEAEQVLWSMLRANRFHGLHFRRQQIIAGYIVDFYCHARQLVIEVDGKIHDLQQEQDKARENALKELGFQIVRFRNEDVLSSLPEIIQQLEAHLFPFPDREGARG